jgi:hypothetical protein
MELGFYHPARGYWQTICVPREDVRARYPQGTIEVPVKPGEGYEWQDGAWIAPPPVEPSA